MSDALPKYEDWKAPWEEKDEEFDADKARRLIYNLHGDKKTLQSKVDTVAGEKKELGDKNTELQGKLDAINRKDESELDRLKRENEELKAKPAESTETPAELRALRLEVALDKGLTAVQAKRLLGSTKEEIEADADDLVKSFGSEGASTEEDGEKPPRRTARRTSTPGDPDPDADSRKTVKEQLDLIPRI